MPVTSWPGSVVAAGGAFGSRFGPRPVSPDGGLLAGGGRAGGGGVGGGGPGVEGPGPPWAPPPRPPPVRPPPPGPPAARAAATRAAAAAVARRRRLLAGTEGEAADTDGLPVALDRDGHGE